MCNGSGKNRVHGDGRAVGQRDGIRYRVSRSTLEGAVVGYVVEYVVVVGLSLAVDWFVKTVPGLRCSLVLTGQPFRITFPHPRTTTEKTKAAGLFQMAVGMLGFVKRNGLS